MLKAKRIECSRCHTTRYVPFGASDFVCQCQKANGDRLTDDRIRVNIDDPQWNLLGANTDFSKRTDKQKKDMIYQQNTKVDTYNTV